MKPSLLCVAVSVMLGLPFLLFGQNFQRQFGTAFDNSFSKIVQNGANFYVLGTNSEGTGTNPTATVTRLNSAGQHQWTLSLNLGSVWNDAVLTPSGDLLVVGATLPAGNSSKSLVGLVTQSGNFSWVKSYDWPGRESLNKIVRSPSPQNANFPYYIVGQEVEAGGLNEDVVLLNMNALGVFNWKKIYLSASDDHFSTDLEVLGNGDLLLTGQRAIFKADKTGALFTGGAVESPFAWVDMAVGTSGNTYAVGGILPNFVAHLAKLDADLSPIWEINIENLTAVNQVWQDAGSGDIVVTGVGFFAGKSRTVMCRFADLGSAPVFLSMKFLDNGASNFVAGFSTILTGDRLAYVDGRIPPTGGFGQVCAFISVTGVDLLPSCMTVEGSVAAPQNSLLFNSPVLPEVVFQDLLQPTALTGSALNWAQADACAVPCNAAFSAQSIGNCGQFQLISQSVGVLPISTQWSNGAITPTITTDLPCGTYDFCLSITDATGCKSTVCQPITVTESVPPVITNCPQNQTVGTNAGQCFYSFSAPLNLLATDNCDPNPTIVCTWSDATGIVSPVSAQTQFPKGSHQIRCIATDKCGNNSIPCVFSLNVVDNQPPTITCPLSISVIGTFSPPPAQCKATVTNIAPIVVDNCPMWTVAYTISGATTASGVSDASGTNFMQGISTITYSVTDMGGNVASCSFTIDVKCDQVPPTSMFKCGMAVTTFYSISNVAQKVLAVRDVRNCAPVPKGYNWLAPTISDASWTVANLGEIFGIAVDKFNNIYVCATSIYAQGFPLSYGLGGSGGIYKIDAATGAISNFVSTAPTNINTVGMTKIPNLNGAGLGNICYDPNHGGPGGQFFVTNLEDGKIYRLNAAGVVQSIFDPFLADVATAGMACEGERIFGIGYLPAENRVYFSQNNQNTNHLGNGPNKIFSVALNGAGDFTGIETLHITLPASGGSYSNPVTDIEFAADGKMILAEHSEYGASTCATPTSGAHASRALEYVGSNFAGWLPSPRLFHVGNYANHQNTAGGIDYGYSCFDPAVTPRGKCDSTVWASGDALVFPGYQPPPTSPQVFLYGIAGISANGNSPALLGNYAPLNCHYVDMDSDVTGGDKYKVGDVDIIHCGCPSQSSICDSISVTSTPSPVATDSCCFKLNVQNLKPNFFTGIQLCANNGVSISAVGALNGWTIGGYAASFIALIPPTPFISTGNMDFIKFCLSNYKNVPNQQIIVKYYGPDEKVVCMDTLNYNCSSKPKCIKVTDTVECAQNGQYKMSFCIMSNALIGWNVNSIQLNPPPGITFTPSVFSVANMLPGQMQCGFMTQISGAIDGQTICYSVTAHKSNITNVPPISPTECCTDTVMLGCVTMPSCICSKVSATAAPVKLIGDTCCWKITLTNGYSNSYFTGIQLDILTPGVVFGAIVNPFGSGWAAVSSSTQANFTPKPLGSFVGASSMLPTFCLSGITLPSQVPQIVVVSWLAAGGVICKDTLYLTCEPVVYLPCAALANWHIDCDPNSPGNYIFSFQVTNNAGFNANQIAFNSILPFGASFSPSNVFNIPSLAPGQTSATQTTTIFGVPAGQNLYFNVTLHEISNGSELNCCTNSQQYCLPMPICPQDLCDCGAFNDIFVRPIQGGQSIPMACGGMPIFIPCPPNNQPLAFSGNFQCQGNNCPPVTVDWSLLNVTTNVTTTGTGLLATPNFNLNLPLNLFAQPGNYTLTLTGHCGNKICPPCVLNFKMDCPPAPACECGGFSNLFARKGVSGAHEPQVCGSQTPFVMNQCPQNGFSYFFGDFNCAGANCLSANLVEYEVFKMPGGPAVISGTTTASPYFIFSLASPLLTTGNYEIRLKGHCGTKICECVIKMVVDCAGPAPCLCSNFQKDMNKGFKAVGAQPLSSCKRTFMPVALMACDSVNWTMDGVYQGFTHGNGNMMITFPGNGNFLVCMNVFRIDANGMICIRQRCQKVKINCVFNPDVSWQKSCDFNQIQNGDFTKNGVSGLLEKTGSMPGWQQFPNPGDGFVQVDTSEGSGDNGHFILNGNANNFAGVVQSVDLSANNFTILEGAVRNYLGENTPVGTVLEFRLQQEPIPNSPSQILETLKIDGENAGWGDFNFSIPMSPSADKKFLVVCLKNGGNTKNSVIGIDNLEICTDASTNTRDIDPKPTYKLYPNPTTGELTIDFGNISLQNGRIELLTNLGQTIRTVPILSGSTRINTQVSELPQGIYFVKITSDNQPMKVLKFVKQ